MSIDQISHVTIIVPDQDEALTWFEDKLGFQKRVDDDSSVPGVRWLSVVPNEDQGIEIVLFKAQDDKDRAKIGKSPMWIFKTENCQSTTAELQKKGVTIVKANETWPWGISTIFEDLYGNYYNLVELKES